MCFSYWLPGNFFFARRTESGQNSDGRQGVWRYESWMKTQIGISIQGGAK